MKTAEEWIKEYNDTRYSEDRKLIFKDGSLIKQIQLDAWKQGMTDAMEIADSLSDITTRQNQTPSQYDIRNAIKKECDNRKDM